MKKIISVFTAILFSLILSGCDVIDLNSIFAGTSNTFDDDLASITGLMIYPKENTEYAVFSAQPEIKDRIYAKAFINDSSDDYCGYEKTDLCELIRWVSTNEDVIAVRPGNKSYYSLNLDLEIIADGETEIYAETVDGRLQSGKIKFTVGNRYSQKSVVTYDSGTYIISRLKYPTKSTTVIDQSREPFFFRALDRRIYTYKDIKNSSYVQVDTVEINGTNVKTKGEIHTFGSGGANAVCGFILELKYNEDFTNCTVVSEKYDIPELIREKLE